MTVMVESSSRIFGKGGWRGFFLFYYLVHVLVFQVVIKGVFVYEHGDEAGGHSRQHQVKDDIVSVRHFQYEDCGCKGGAGDARKKSHHAG